jgi:hypothetical protein
MALVPLPSPGSRRAHSSVGVSDPVYTLNSSLHGQFPLAFDPTGSAIVARGQTYSSTRGRSDTFSLTHATSSAPRSPECAQLPLVRPYTGGDDDEEITWEQVGMASPQPRRVPTGLPRVATLPPSRGGSRRRPGTPALDASVESRVRASTPFGVSTKDARPTTAAEYIADKLAVLRRDTGERERFFVEVAEIKHTIVQRQKDGGTQAWQTDHTGASRSPERRAEERASSRQERRRHEEEVSQRRELHEDETRLRRALIAEAGYRDRIVARTAVTATEREARRATEWVKLISTLCAIPKQVKAIVVAERAALTKSFETTASDPMSLAVIVGALMCLQKWWRAIRPRIVFRRWAVAARTLRGYFHGLDHVKVKFAVALHRLRQKIVMIQRRRRAVMRCRALRREQADRLIQRAIEKECTAVERAADLIFQQRSSLEKALNASIKARRPVFEAQLAENQILLQNTLRRRTSLNALTPQSLRRLVDDPISEREAVFNAAVLDYGAVLAARKKQVEATVRRAKTMRAGSELMFVPLKNGGLIMPKVARPVGRVGLTPDEARAIVKIRAVALGFLDFCRDMQTRSKTKLAEPDPRVLEDAEDILPELPPDTARPMKSPRAIKSPRSQQNNPSGKPTATRADGGQARDKGKRSPKRR